MKGASAAAPASRNGRVTLLPAHIRMLHRWRWVWGGIVSVHGGARPHQDAAHCVAGGATSVASHWTEQPRPTGTLPTRALHTVGQAAAHQDTRHLPLNS